MAMVITEQDPRFRVLAVRDSKTGTWFRSGDQSLHPLRRHPQALRLERPASPPAREQHEEESEREKEVFDSSGEMATEQSESLAVGLEQSWVQGPVWPGGPFRAEGTFQRGEDTIHVLYSADTGLVETPIT